MQKLKSVEMLRCVAAILVVLFHTETIAGTRMAKPPFDGAFSGGSHGVDLFFVLSGFIISYVHHGDVGRRRSGLDAWLRRHAGDQPVFASMFNNDRCRAKRALNGLANVTSRKEIH